MYRVLPGKVSGSDKFVIVTIDSSMYDIKILDGSNPKERRDFESGFRYVWMHKDSRFTPRSVFNIIDWNENSLFFGSDGEDLNMGPQDWSSFFCTEEDNEDENFDIFSAMKSVKSPLKK